MRFTVYGLFLFSPVLLLQYAVMPELDKMKDFYSNIDHYANQAAGVDTNLPQSAEK